MKKKTKVLTVMMIILFLAIIGVSIWLIVVDTQSRNYNLLKLDVSKVNKPTTNTPVFEGEIALSTGVTMHYAKYGNSGTPLILIHGNGGSHLSLETLACQFSEEYTVYAIDSRCQGQSSKTDKISYSLMASDVNAFCSAMNIENPLVIGHSDGGIVALQIAMDYPDLMKGFISCGANSKPKMFKPYFLIWVTLSYKFKHKELDRIMVEEPNFTAEGLAKITCPAYIVAGEFDIVKLKDTAFIANSINNSKISIIKWADHSNYMHDGAKGYSVFKPFFDSLK